MHVTTFALAQSDTQKRVKCCPPVNYLLAEEWEMPDNWLSVGQQSADF